MEQGLKPGRLIPQDNDKKGECYALTFTFNRTFESVIIFYRSVLGLDQQREHAFPPPPEDFPLSTFNSLEPIATTAGSIRISG